MNDEWPGTPTEKIDWPGTPVETAPVSGGRAAYEGFKHGATAGLSDALSSVPGGYAPTDIEGIPFLSPEQHDQRINAARRERVVQRVARERI